jgi:hypothetical protein
LSNSTYELSTSSLAITLSHSFIMSATMMEFSTCHLCHLSDAL